MGILDKVVPKLNFKQAMHKWKWKSTCGYKIETFVYRRFLKSITQTHTHTHKHKRLHNIKVTIKGKIPKCTTFNSIYNFNLIFE